MKLSKGLMDISQCSLTHEAALLSFINLTKSPSFALNSYNNIIINESRTSSDEENH